MKLCLRQKVCGEGWQAGPAIAVETVAKGFPHSLGHQRGVRCSVVTPLDLGRHLCQPEGENSLISSVRYADVSDQVEESKPLAGRLGVGS